MEYSPSLRSRVRVTAKDNSNSKSNNEMRGSFTAFRMTV